MQKLLWLDLHRDRACQTRQIAGGEKNATRQGNKKRRSTHTETRRPGRDVLKNERVHSTPSVGRKGRQFYRKFIFKSFPFYRYMSIKSNYAISRVGFPTNDCIVWPSGSAGGMGGTAGKKKKTSGGVRPSGPTPKA